MTVYSPIPYTAEDLEEQARRECEKIAIWRLFGEAYYKDVYNLNEWMWRLVMEQAKEEYLRDNAWARRYFS
jgi:hypothetical protein